MAKKLRMIEVQPSGTRSGVFIHLNGAPQPIENVEENLEILEVSGLTTISGPEKEYAMGVVLVEEK